MRTRAIFLLPVLAAACSSSSGGGNPDGGSAGSGGASGSGGAGGSGGASGSGGAAGSGGSGGSAGHAGDDGGDSAACSMTSCAGKCVDTSKDADNCGFCGNACGSFQTCTSGACVSGQTCPGAPGGSPAQASAAYGVENDARAASGVPCASLVGAIDTSAADHCAYYAANVGSGTCDSDAHVEVMGCKDFVAAQFWDRMTAAGYKGSPAFEDMAFVDDPASAMAEWIDSVWHRVPILSPWVRDIGYGAAVGCDTMDFGVGATTPASATATYPYPGQTGVPTSFNGAQEGPEPPTPPGGWPSGYPITVYLKAAKTPTVHTITVLGSATPLDHQLLSPQDASSDGLLTDEVILYTNTPLTGATRYHVHVEATGAAGAQTFDWVFSTK